jgi:hypothetical protein
MGCISAPFLHLELFVKYQAGLLHVLEGPANNSDFNSDAIPCKALERVNSDVPNIVDANSSGGGGNSDFDYLVLLNVKHGDWFKLRQMTD